MVAHHPATITTTELVEEELTRFKSQESLDINLSLLSWWKSNQHIYTFLSTVVKRLLCIPATSVPSDRVFSTAGDVVTAQRDSLRPENVDMLVFLTTECYDLTT